MEYMEIKKETQKILKEVWSYKIGRFVQFLNGQIVNLSQNTYTSQQQFYGTQENWIQQCYKEIHKMHNKLREDGKITSRIRVSPLVNSQIIEQLMNCYLLMKIKVFVDYDLKGNIFFEEETSEFLPYGCRTIYKNIGNLQILDLDEWMSGV